MSAKGFDAAAFRPSYGLAEATLAVAFADGLETHDPPAPSPDAGQPTGKARRFVVCGRVISGHELIIAAPDGAQVPAGQVGRILVRGPSIMDGYVHPSADGSPLTSDGFLDTGDLGYLVEGKLVVTGRAKDVLHFRGRNIWPEDIEWTVEQIPPLKAGDAAAFGVSDEAGDDRLVVLVQSGLDQGEAEALCHRVRTAISEGAGVICEVVRVPPRSLPLTSSGKLSRQAARLKYLGGQFGRILITRLAPNHPHRLAALVQQLALPAKPRRAVEVGSKRASRRKAARKDIISTTANRAPAQTRGPTLKENECPAFAALAPASSRSTDQGLEPDFGSRWMPTMETSTWSSGPIWCPFSASRPRALRPITGVGEDAEHGVEKALELRDARELLPADRAAGPEPIGGKPEPFLQLRISGQEIAGPAHRGGGCLRPGGEEQGQLMLRAQSHCPAAALNSRIRDNRLSGFDLTGAK